MAKKCYRYIYRGTRSFLVVVIPRTQAGARGRVVVVVVVVLKLTRIIKSVVTGQAPVTLELRNTPGKTHKQNQKWYTCYISCS